MILMFVAIVELLLAPDLGMISPFDHDSIVVTPYIGLEGMAVLGKNGVPQELDWSLKLLTLVLSTIGFVSMSCF